MKFPYKFIDLSQQVSPSMPLWPGDPETQRLRHSTYQEVGYNLNSWSVGEHSGTHVGAPSHYLESGRSIERYGANELFLEASVFDLPEMWHSEAAADIETQLAYLIEDENQNGPFPDEGIVILRTGWAKRWPESEEVFQLDDGGNLSSPGFMDGTVSWLLEKRGIRAIGTDAPEIGTASNDPFAAGKTLAEAGALHVENLCNLELLPKRGFHLLLSPLKLESGTGSPARVWALIPEKQE